MELGDEEERPDLRELKLEYEALLEQKKELSYQLKLKRQRDSRLMAKVQYVFRFFRRCASALLAFALQCFMLRLRKN